MRTEHLKITNVNKVVKQPDLLTLLLLLLIIVIASVSMFKRFGKGEFKKLNYWEMERSVGALITLPILIILLVYKIITQYF
ncbi:hypothetical protein HYN48_13720 [Flavobacterium magnum]|uniref:Uncharacterized protein n=1 Tax=Flavobacterium magnum TaxID=2162713 RepID=A0A2S0RGJ6_9FLAO|nr:hypothetical protein HYN48_13720 [Flavobacterium magnum]